MRRRRQRRQRRMARSVREEASPRPRSAPYPDKASVLAAQNNIASTFASHYMLNSQGEVEGTYKGNERAHPPSQRSVASATTCQRKFPTFRSRHNPIVEAPPHPFSISKTLFKTREPAAESHASTAIARRDGPHPTRISHPRPADVAPLPSIAITDQPHTVQGGDHFRLTEGPGVIYRREDFHPGGLIDDLLHPVTILGPRRTGTPPPVTEQEVAVGFLDVPRLARHPADALQFAEPRREPDPNVEAVRLAHRPDVALLDPPHPLQDRDTARITKQIHAKLPLRRTLRAKPRQSPMQGYPPNHSPYHQNQSPGYYPNQPYPQPGFQNSPHRGGYRGGGYHGPDRRMSGPGASAPFAGPGGRGRGAAPTQYSNLSWTPSSGTRGGRPATEAPRPQPVTSQSADSASVDADDNPFRPSKDLRVEDEGPKEEKKPPKSATPTAPKAGFTFSLMKLKNSVPSTSKAKLGIEEPEKAESSSKESLLDTKAKAVTERDARYAESRNDRDRDVRDRDYERERDRDRDRENRERDRRYDDYYDRKPAYRDPRDRDIRDPRDTYYRGRERDYRDPRERDMRDIRDPRDMRDRDVRDRDPRDIRDRREPYPPRRLDDRRPERPDSRTDIRPARPERRTPPPQIPKTKTIIKKRMKPRPTLDPEHANSDSVYYRKPGNESVVGSGTYGKVFKGIHVYTKDLVALKKIRMEGERDGFPVTAIREVKLLQSLNHPNIVNLREVMVEKNDCYMVFEYLSHDLTGLLNHPTFKLEQAHKKDLAKQLFEGLDYLHRRGVLHRDIKAANILVSNTGQLKLADFGLARFYAKSSKLDYTNRVITIWYRSPELLLGETQYGPAVDIWSAACVLVEIFTRHAIFPGSGGEISQLDKIYNVLGTPTVQDWPGIVDMQWSELLRPTERKQSTFEEKYKDRVSPMAFELLQAMFLFDPNARPTAADVLEHPFFTSEAPPPKRADALKELEGDWHEFESKALRKEKDKQEHEARRVAREEKDLARKDEGKRRAEAAAGEERDAKRAKSGDVTA
ncbi:Serine/threonine-protein kinase bur1 [Pyrenophora tritici-repentis]|nr:Serine/threonine-protein kinase bur1 [Pyrenophora tritici-repentis]